LLGSFTCPKVGTWGRLFNFPSEGRHAEDFYIWKIQRLRPGLNPRNREPEASMLTNSRQVKHECICLRKIWLSLHRRFSRKLICADKHQAGISIPSFSHISRRIWTVQAGSNLRLQTFNDEP
jgi:hypothetical protein